MKSTARLGTVTLALALAVGASVGLSGCANPIDAIVQQGIEGAVEGATGTKVDVEGGGTSIPDDFPVTDLLIDGTVESAGSVSVAGYASWTVTLAVSDFASAFEEGKAKITDAGYVEGYVMQDDASALSSWTNDDYSIAFNVTSADGKAEAYYAVSEIGK